jgi:hypothetical protein
MDMIDYALTTIVVSIIVITFSLGVSTFFLCVDIYKRLRKPTQKASNFSFHSRDDFMSRDQRIA